MDGYVDVPTRGKLVGALDKAILMDAVSESLTGDRDFNELVLSTVAGAGNAADAQAIAWATFVEGLPYRREHMEIYRSWRDVVAHGGDCDDLTIVLVGGLLSLGMPAVTEILADSNGWGFHVRARVGLPPHSPTVWAIVDPVWESERQWAMAGRDPNDSLLLHRGDEPVVPPGTQLASALQGRRKATGGSSLRSAYLPQPSSMPSLSTILLLAAAWYGWTRWGSRAWSRT